MSVPSRRVTLDGVEHVVHFLDDGRASKIVRLEPKGDRTLWTRNRPAGARTMAVLRAAGCQDFGMRLPSLQESTPADGVSLQESPPPGDVPGEDGT